MRKPRYRPYLAIGRISKQFVANLEHFRAFVGVRRATNPVRHALCVRCARVKLTLWGSTVCAALSMCHAPLCVCRAPEKRLQTHSKHVLCTLNHFAMFLYDLGVHNDFVACGNLYIKAFGVMSLIFSSSKRTLLMSCFGTFSLI